MSEVVESRVAVLEEISRSTKAALERIEANQRSDRERLWTVFLWLLTFIIGGWASVLAAVVALWLRVGDLTEQVHILAAHLH